MDSSDIDRLTAHDVENSVGIIQLRGQANPGPAGYQQWWLTTDRAARGSRAHLEAELGTTIHSPVISPAYLVRLVLFRPHTTEETKSALDRFPVLMDLAKMDAIPVEMIEVVEGIRKEILSISSRLIKRKIRDKVNKRKAEAADTDDRVEIEDPIG